MNPFQTGYGSVKAWDASVKARRFSFSPQVSLEGFRFLTNASGNVGMALGALIGIILFIAFGSSLIGPIANFTTGIVTAHTGFTPNVNVTSSPGVSALLPLIPLVFVGLIIVGAVSAYGVKFNFE